MKFDVVTLFPELIMDSVNHGITSRALKDKKISLKTYNPRLFSNRKGAQIDIRIGCLGEISYFLSLARILRI